MFKQVRHAYRLINSLLRERKKSKTRSTHWPKVRNNHLKYFPACAACMSRKHLQVHHISPLHLYPELELTDKNLITLCMGSNECHFRLAHGANWEAFNPFIVAHASILLHQPMRRKELEALAKRTRLFTPKKIVSR